jgi:CRP/FNR family cyclic AMP-dependent transcriptional regulator
MNHDIQSRSMTFLGLRGIKLFEGLDTFSLEEVARQCRWKRYRRNDRVISRDDKDREVYLVVSGTVRVAILPASGRGVIFRDIPAGEVFGELAALDEGARSADVHAVSDCLLASMSPEVFHGVLGHYPGVRQRLFRQLSTSVRELTDRLVELSTLDVEHRIAMELLRNARRSGELRNGIRLQPLLTHKEIASRVGTSREQVTRALSLLVRRSLIAREGRTLVIQDAAGLERMLSERAGD